MKSLVAHFSTPLITARLVPRCIIHRASISAVSFSTVRRRFSPLTMASAAQSSSQVPIWRIQCLEFYWWICVLVLDCRLVVGEFYWSGKSVNLYLDWCGSLICNFCADYIYEFYFLWSEKEKVESFSKCQTCAYKALRVCYVNLKGESYIRQLLKTSNFVSCTSTNQAVSYGSGNSDTDVFKLIQAHEVTNLPIL